MSTVIIIGGGGGNRTTMSKGFTYPVSQGDGVTNEGATTVHLSFTPAGGSAGDFWLGPTTTVGFMAAGTLELL